MIFPCKLKQRSDIAWSPLNTKVSSSFNPILSHFYEMILFWKNHNRLKISTMYEVHSTYVLTKYLLKMYFAHWIYFWNSNLNFHDFFYQLKKGLQVLFGLFLILFITNNLVKNSGITVAVGFSCWIRCKKENRPQYES